MPKQKSQALVQRRNSVIEAIKRLSGQSNRWVTISEIIDDINGQGYTVKKHNIRRDLEAVLPIYTQLEINDNSKADEKPINGLAYGYRWIGKDLEPTTGITLPEALSLVMVERYLSQSLPVLLTQSLNEIFSKAHQTLELHKKSEITHWPDKISVIQPSQSLIPPKVNQIVLTTVHEALLKEKQIQVVYQPSNQAVPKEKSYRLHTLGIIQRGPITYLSAMANDYEDVYIYALHRIRLAELLDQDSRKKENFDLNSFANKQGHFGSGEPINFKAIICANLAVILEETPLSETQLITNTNKTGFKEINAILPNTWQLRWWVLGEGERIEVLKPVELRSEIARTLKEAGQFYEPTEPRVY